MSERLPILPLRTVLLPGDLLPLQIFEPRCRLLLSRCAENHLCSGVVLTKRGCEVSDQPEIHPTGTSVTVIKRMSPPDGRSNVLVTGARRFQVLESDWDERYMTATITWLDTTDAGSGLRDAVSRIHELLDRYLSAYNQAAGRSAMFRDFGEEPTAFAYAVAATMPMPLEARKRLLEARPPNQLLSLL